MKKTKRKKTTKKTLIFFLVIATLAVSFAVFFTFQKSLADTISGWATGVWNDLVIIAGVPTNTGIPTIGWLSSGAGLSGCPGAAYGVTLAGNDGDNPRIIRGAAWFGIGSNPATNCANEPSLGWLNFDQGAPSFCNTGDCHPAQWHKTGSGPASDYTGYIDGWAQVSSMTNMPKPDGTTAQNGWVRIYGAKVDSAGNVTNENNYAWNSGEETAISGNSGLGWIKLDGLKINNCTGHPGGCSTVSLCQGGSLGSAGSSCDNTRFCSNDSGAACTIIGPTSWTCGNGCETNTCGAGNIFWVLPETGACGILNGKSVCDSSQTPADDNLCANGSAPRNFTRGGIQATWVCGSTECGGTESSQCSALDRCGWIETNP